MKKEYHSRSYHRFFEDYMEERVEENGKVRIVRIYTGDYYCPVLTKKDRKARRCCTAALYLLTIFIYVYCATRRYVINTVWFLAVCQGLSLIALFWFLIPFYYYLTAKEKLTIRQLRDASGLLKKVSIGASVCFGGTAVAVLAASCCTWKYMSSIWELQLFPLSLVNAVMMYGIYYMEKKTKYEVRPGDQKSLPNGERIKY